MTVHLRGNLVSLPVRAEQTVLLSGMFQGVNQSSECGVMSTSTLSSLVSIFILCSSREWLGHILGGNR